MSTRKEIALVLTSLIMIGAALVVNPITFRYLLGNELTSTTGHVFVWILNLLFVGSGLFVFLNRKAISGRRAFSGFAYILSLLVFIEVVLQAVAAFSPKMNFILSQLSPIVEDERLGYRPSAFHPEHDANGFRNASIPEAADIVAMGDSQTYGNNATRDEAWPQQLSRQSGLISYNMAFGGYSPVHSIILLKEAFSLHPKVIINGVYSGNDLEEAYWFVYLQDKLSKMKSTDVQLVNELAGLEASTPSGFTKKEFEQEDLKISIKTANFLKAILRLIVLKFETMDKHWELYKKKAALNDEFILDTPDHRTIFTAKRRLAALDLSDIRIREGARIILESLVYMHDQSENTGINFIVLLIPTKELVYSDVVNNLVRSTIPDSYSTLISNEEAYWELLKSRLDSERIKYIDSLPYLRASVQNGERPYSINRDGHPNKVGYCAIAKAVMASLERKTLPR